MNLYTIANQYQEILDKTFDHETGEVNQNAIALLEIVKDNMQEKGIAIASFIKNIEAERDAIEQAKKAMAERETRLNKRVDYLTQYLQSNMERCGMHEIKCAYFSIKLKKCPISVDVFNESSLPEEYKKVKSVISVDKIKLKEEILAGVIVPGATIKQNMRLEIR